jgi:hypothetical protein
MILILLGTEVRMDYAGDRAGDPTKSFESA